MDNGENSIATLKPKGIRIASINVNSIISNQRRASLTDFLKAESPDILLKGGK